MSIFSDSKDRLLEGLALPLLNNSVLKPYGRATNLRLNSTAKTVDLELALNGEPEVLRVRVTDYELIQAEDGAYVVIKGIHTSRVWLTTLAEQQLLNRRWKLPPQAASLLMRLL